MRWEDDIPEEVKQDRLQRLLKLQSEIEMEDRKKMLGQTYEVLVERKNRDENVVKGRTRCWQKIILPGDESLVGTFQQVHVESQNHQTLIGTLCCS